MGFKKINGFWLIHNGAMTGTTTVTSAPQNISNFDNIALEISWTGTPTGTINILGSISESFPQAVQAGLANYYPLTFSPALTSPVGSADAYLVYMNEIPYPYIEVQYVNVSGSGVLNVFLFSKDLN